MTTQPMNPPSPGQRSRQRETIGARLARRAREMLIQQTLEGEAEWLRGQLCGLAEKWENEGSRAGKAHAAELRTLVGRR